MLWQENMFKESHGEKALSNNTLMVSKSMIMDI